jgi:hypothetical protein
MARICLIALIAVFAIVALADAARSDGKWNSLTLKLHVVFCYDIKKL